MLVFQLMVLAILMGMVMGTVCIMPVSKCCHVTGCRNIESVVFTCPTSCDDHFMEMLSYHFSLPTLFFLRKG